MLKYMITSAEYSLNQIFNAIKTHRPDFVCYRNKHYFDKNEILEFVSFAKNYSKLFINFDDLKDDDLLNYFDGIHFPSSKLKFVSQYKNKTTIASTHNKKEVLTAKDADYITFSPVFYSKNRKGAGIEKLNEICKYHNRVIALGGIISDREVEKIKNSNAAGFASIRYFFK